MDATLGVICISRSEAQGRRLFVIPASLFLALLGTAARVALAQKYFKTLVDFGRADGAAPLAGLAMVQATNGGFYGATGDGGSNSSCTRQYGCGTLFALGVRLEPFVESLPAAGTAGAKVGLLGTDLAGVTSVTFNGTPATFTAVSASLITTTVPEGATTGTVQVVTPAGTLSSNVPFRVLP